MPEVESRPAQEPRTRGGAHRPRRVRSRRRWVNPMRWMRLARRHVLAPIIDWSFNRRISALLLRRRHVLGIGDSHIGALSNVRIPGVWFRARPLNGATATGVLNPDSRTKSHVIFGARLARAKPWQQVILQLGEVDCGFVIWDRASRRGLSAAEQLTLTLDSYEVFLRRVLDMGFARVLVLSVPLPTIGDDPTLRGHVARFRRGVTASQAQRTELTLQFNSELRRRCEALEVEFVDVTSDLLDPLTGLIDRRYMRETHHDHHLADEPYAQLIASALAPLMGVTSPTSSR